MNQTAEPFECSFSVFNFMGVHVSKSGSSGNLTDG
jgi:hypothetical protein